MANPTFAILPLLGLLSACAQFEDTVLEPVGTKVNFSGVIDANTVSELDAALRASPDIDTIVLVSVPGSVDDDASLTNLLQFIRANQLTTTVPSDGVVASGGTDMALMGINRIIEPGACVGVHSWDARGLFGGDAGADLPWDHPEHALYLEFYDAIGIDEAFYWYTLTVAGPDDIHWMSPEEINRFGLSSRPVPAPDGMTDRERQDHCEARP